MHRHWNLFAELIGYVAMPSAETSEEYQLLLSLLSMALQSRDLAVWKYDPATDRLDWDEQLLRLYGIGPEDFGGHFEDWRKRVLPEDLAQTEAHLGAFLEGKTTEPAEFRIVRPDGSQRIVNGWAVAQRDEHGTITRLLGMNWDVTEARRLEAQVRQAQKMDAIGRLTGGIAHDFNNMLAVILGYLELAQDSQDMHEIKECIHEAFDGARRCVALTQQLLAFSRQQPLKPEIVDPAVLVQHSIKMLRRLLSEDIQLEIVIDEAPWPCLIDPHQLETAIVNLAINARDAMPDGGRLLIEVTNVTVDDSFAAHIDGMEPGDYICVSVTDTGTGIAPEIAERVFEPFFTTKSFGRGTGLGLSMVLGFVRQSDGFVKLYSEPGEGTTVKLFLPRTNQQPDHNPQSPIVRPHVADGSRVILVVEDDASLRALFGRILNELGYRPILVENGISALDVLTHAKRIDAVLTDVVLPGGMNGRQLVDQVHTQQPNLPVLFMSGYTANALMYRGRLEPGVTLLQKPFSRAELALRLAQVLGDNDEVHEYSTP